MRTSRAGPHELLTGAATVNASVVGAMVTVVPAPLNNGLLQFCSVVVVVALAAVCDGDELALVL